MGVPIGVSGTLVGTALESVGYYYQSYLFDTLGGIISGPVAVLCFVIGAMIALTRLVLTGKPGMIIWLLVGPTLFYAILSSRTQTFGSEWKFGRNARNQQQVALEVREYMRQPDVIEEASISSLFATYNKVVSSLISHAVAMIVQSKESIDARFLLRTQLTAVVRSQNVEDPGLRMLIHEKFFRECSEMLDYASKIRDPYIPEATRRAMEPSFVTAQNKKSAIDGLAKDYAASLSAKYPGLEYQIFTGTTESVAQWLSTSGLNGTDPNDTSGFESRKKTAINEIEYTYSNQLTCGQVWNFVFAGLYHTAQAIAKNALNQGKSVEESELMKDLMLLKQGDLGQFAALAESNKAQQLHALVRIISAYLLRNEMQQQSGAAFVNAYAKKGFEFTALKVPSENDLSHLERLRLRSIEWDYRSRIVNAATNLPYYQGLALNFLEVLFIFFAALLLIPGKQNGFFLWFILWFWVKSWDVGIAIVMLLDDILFSLFTYWNGAKEAFGGSTLGIDTDLRVTWYGIQQLDPTFQLTTYYSIIAGALGSIPVVSSYLIVGSLKGGGGLISETMSKHFMNWGWYSKSGGGAQTAVAGLKVAAFDEEMKRAKENVEAEVSGGEKRPNIELLNRGNTSGIGPQQGGSGQRIQDDARRHAQQAGQAAGAAVGPGTGHDIGNLFQKALRISPGMGAAMRNSLNTIGNGVQTWGTFEKTLRLAGLDRERGLLNAHIDAASAAAPLATFNEEKVLKWSAQSRAMGQLEVPWADRDGAWDAELKKEVFDITSQRIFDAAHFKSWEDSIARFGFSLNGLVSLGIATTLEKEHERLLGSHRIEDTVVRMPLEDGQFGDGWRNANGTPGHFGQEITVGASGKDEVKPTNDGLLIFKGEYGEYGTVAIVAHRNNTFTVYANLKDKDGLAVSEGQWVETTDTIGIATTTNHSTVPSFHFAVVDPTLRFIDPKPMFSDKLPLESTQVDDNFKSLLLSQLAKYQPQPRPYPDQ